MNVAWFAMFVVVGLVGVALVIAGLAIRRSRRGLGLAVVAVGGLIALAVVAVPVVTVLMPRSSDTVWVAGLGDSDERFSLAVDHRPVSVEGSRYVFRTDLPWKELVDDATAAYPDAVSMADGWWWVGLGDTVFVMSPSADASDEFVVSAQYAYAGEGTGGDTATVPFPVVALRRDAVQWGEPLDVGWTSGQWGEFYSLIGVQPTDGVFTVPTGDGGSADVVVGDAGVATILRN